MLTACGNGGEAKSAEEKPPSQQPAALKAGQQLVSAAAEAIDRTYTADYQLTKPDGTTGGTVRVSKTVDALRYDHTYPGDATTYPHTATLARTGDGTFRCITGANGSGCVQTGPKDAKLPDEPRLAHAFADWLPTLASRSAALSVETVSANDAGLPAAAGACFSLERLTSSVEPPVDLGVYCFDDLGTITALKLSSGSLLLTTAAAPPETITLPTSVTPNLPDVVIPPPSPSPVPSPATSQEPSPTA